jgi:hypothetical protein
MFLKIHRLYNCKKELQGHLLTCKDAPCGLLMVKFVPIWKTCSSWGRVCLCGAGDVGTVEFLAKYSVTLKLLCKKNNCQAVGMIQAVELLPISKKPPS